MLSAQTDDGLWKSIVVTIFDGMPGVSCPNVSPYVEPVFHSDEASATSFALECIKKAHPALANRDLHKCAADYFDDE